MKKMSLLIGKPSLRLTSFIFFLCLVMAGCQKDNHPPKLPGNYQQVNLVSTTAEYTASRIDPFNANAWGLSFSAGGTAWISAQASHVSTVYNSEGLQARAPVAIPSPVAATGGNPTGVAFNATPNFVLSNGVRASFLFVGVDGVISGWNGAAGNTALRVLNNAATAAYTGCQIGSDGNNNFLYAANFRGRTIDVFDADFKPVSKAFKDPYLPAGYAPFNIQNIGDKFYVMYAKVGPDGRDQKGEGNGYVSIFNTNGSFVRRFASKGALNSPWGVALAPGSFFAEGNGKVNLTQPAILVGNFGDGKINAYNLDGELLGQLTSGGKTIKIDGLWAITFAPATATTIDPNRLYFTAGPDEEAEGLFGYIKKQ